VTPMHPARALSGHTLLTAVFGDPVAHSLSPAMHNAAYEALAMDRAYVACHVTPERLREALRAIPALGLLGVNLTVPHKERAVRLMAQLTDEARLLHAVNCVINRNGELHGDNTDARGLQADLCDQDVTVAGKQFAQAYYAAPVQHAYFDGCSTGGRMAMMEAERYPNDYDGIIAGDPNMDYHAGLLRFVVQKAALSSPAAYVPQSLWVAIDKKIQQAIYAEGNGAAEAGDRHRQVIKYAWDTRVTADPLVGELDTDTGHCTFISGIVRQVAADAQVLAIRIMHGDGIVNEGDLLCALRHVAKRIALAEAGDMTAMVDVVSLSLGYFSESAAHATHSSGVRKGIDVLLALGVIVVAAAGNFSTSRRFYPAGFSQQPVPPGQAPLVAVGALNPDGTKAVFSDGGHWITAWAAGAAVVSTFPTDINGSCCPQVRTHDRAALDPDDYSGGFAVWSGTSFSAPLVAAHIAGSLLAGAADPGLRLDLPGKTAATSRALAALQNLGWEG